MESLTPAMFLAIHWYLPSSPCWAELMIRLLPASLSLRTEKTLITRTFPGLGPAYLSSSLRISPFFLHSRLGAGWPWGG